MKTYKKLSDISELISGYAFKSDNYVSNGIRVVRITNVQDGYFSDEHPCFCPVSIINELGKAVLQENDLLMSLTGNIGRVSFLPKSMLPAGLNQRVECIRTGDINLKKYLYYYFRTSSFVSEALRNSSGVAQLNLSTRWLGEHLIPMVGPEERVSIVKNLETIDLAIKKCEQELAYYDELTKSRFNELFMHRSLQKNRLVDVSLSSGEYGACSASVEYDVNRPRYVRITDINDDGTLNDDLVSSKVLSDDNEYRLSYGDFLFARMGATVGKTYAFYSGNQIYAGYLIKYKLDLSKINPRYLYWYTKQNEYWDWVKIKQSGAAQPGINAKKYDSLEIPLAPIKEQDEFAAFVKQVDKLKFSI